MDKIMAERDLKEFSGSLYDDPIKLRNAEFERMGYKTKEEIENYYIKSSYNAFDLARWHDTSAVRESVFRICEENAHGKMLDFGAGIGTNCIRIAMAGDKIADADIYYYDLNEFSKAFAAWRFKKHNLNIKILNQLENWYDVIYMIDVIGHLAEPQKTLKDLVERLKPYGKLIFTNDAIESKEHPMHRGLDFNLDQFLKDNGMSRINFGHVNIWYRSLK